jgi:ribosome-associated translation inhibitor RaiA
MQIQVTTDSNIESSSRLTEYVRDNVEGSIGHYSDRITRVIVHLTDENGQKGGDHDKRCAIEARLAGLKPVGVTHSADSQDQALDGAIERLIHVLDHTFGRLDGHKGHTPMGGPTE